MSKSLRLIKGKKWLKVLYFSALFSFLSWSSSVCWQIPRPGGAEESPAGLAATGDMEGQTLMWPKVGKQLPLQISGGLNGNIFNYRKPRGGLWRQRTDWSSGGCADGQTREGKQETFNTMKLSSGFFSFRETWPPWCEAETW